MAETLIVPEFVIVAALKKAIEILILKYDELGMRASGEWAKDLDSYVDGFKGIIRGADYTQYLTRGREPGKPPPVDVIYQWMQEKKTFTGEKTWNRAWAISQSIAKKGTSWYQVGGSDLVEVLESNEAIDAYYEIIGSYLRVDIAQQLVRTFEELE